MCRDDLVFQAGFHVVDAVLIAKWQSFIRFDFVLVAQFVVQSAIETSRGLLACGGEDVRVAERGGARGGGIDKFSESSETNVCDAARTR